MGLCPVFVLGSAHLGRDLRDDVQVNGIAEWVLVERRRTPQSLLPAMQRVNIAAVGRTHEVAVGQTLYIRDAHPQPFPEYDYTPPRRRRLVRRYEYLPVVTPRRVRTYYAPVGYAYPWAGRTYYRW